MTSEKLIKLNILAEELRDKRSKSSQAVSDLFTQGYITFKQADNIMTKIRNKYVKERLKIEGEKNGK